MIGRSFLFRARILMLPGTVVLFCLSVAGCKTTIGALGEPGPSTEVAQGFPAPVVGASSAVFPNNPAVQGSVLTIDFNNVAAPSATDHMMSYSLCVYDQVIDGVVAATAASCVDLPGDASFSASTGILTWTPSVFAQGTFEILVRGSNPGGSDDATVQVSVREAYSSSNLVCNLEAGYATFTTAASNPTSTWRDLTTNGFDGWLTNTAGTTSSGWAGSGTAAAPYRAVFDGTDDFVALGTNVIPATRNAMMLSTWINPDYVDASGKIIAGNGGYTGNGFAIQQSDTSSGRIELAVGKKLSYSQVVIADAPVGYWRFGETAGVNAADASGNGRTGTYTGAGVTYSQTGALSGDSNTAALFDGTNGYVDVTNHASLNPTAGFTLEAWVKATGAFPAQQKVIIEKPFTAHAAPFYQYSLLAFNSSSMLCYASIGGAFVSAGIANAGINTTTYTHVVCTYDGRNLRMYANGQEVGTLATVGTVDTYATDVKIGAHGNLATERFPGHIDEPAIYSYALSAGQVKAHYDAGQAIFYPSTVLASQPRAYWRLNETNGLQAQDISTTRTHVATVTSSGVTYGAAGALSGDSDTAMTFNGSAGYLETPYHANLNPSTFSVEGWVRPTGGAGTFRTAFANRNIIGAATYGYVLYASTANTWMFYYGDGVGGFQTPAAGAVTLNAWTHLAITYDGGRMRIYVNGSLVTNVAATFSPNTARPFRIGAGANENVVPSAYWIGDLDEIAVYSHTLSATEIANHYASGAFTKCQSRSVFTNSIWRHVSALWDGTTAKLLVDGREECSVQPGTTFTNASSAFAVGASASGSNAWSGSVADVKVYSSGNAADVATNFVQTAERFRATSVGGIVNDGLLINFDAANASRAISSYSVGCATTDLVWYDLTRYLYDGTLKNFAAADCSGAPADGWQGNGTALNPYRLKFDGTNDYVAGPSITLPASMSVEYWIRTTSWLQRPVLSNRNGNGTYIGIAGGRAFAYHANAVPVMNFQGPPLINTGGWQQLVFTSDGTTNKLYVNGTLANQATAVRPAQTFPVNIGHDINNNEYFPDDIAVVRVYSGELTPAQINQNCEALESRFNGFTCN